MLLLLRLLDLPRCVRRSPQAKQGMLQSGRSRLAVFLFRPVLLRRLLGQVRFFPVRASLCREHLRRHACHLQLDCHSIRRLLHKPVRE
jgi:hypothetical protein